MMLSRSDLRYTLRQMGRKPGFVVLAALVLAGGLAVSLMAFTICHTVFFRTLPVTNGERIVHLCSLSFGCGEFRADDFARIRRELSGLDNVGIYRDRGVSMEYGDAVWRSRAVDTEWNLFQLTDTRALLGRTLQAGDHAAGAEAVAVIGHALWQERFAGAADIVGGLVAMDGKPVRIVGVMPEGYAMPYSAQLWLPVTPTLLAPPAGTAPMPLVRSFGLLAPGANREQVSQALMTQMARNREQFPPDPAAEYPNPYLRTVHRAAVGFVTPFPDIFGDEARLFVMIIMNTLTLLVFLLACINVGTLLLARINERMKDTSLKVALGAPRLRLLLQLCLESTFITLLGTALAVLLAGMGLEAVMRATRYLGQGLLAFWMEVRVDSSTLVGAALYAVLTILLTAVVPAWRIINGDFNAALRDGTRGALGLRPGRFSRGLVVSALAIVTLLLYLATLLSSALLPAARMLGEVPVGLVSGGIVLDPLRSDEAARQQFVRNLAARMAREPSIEFANVFVELGEATIEAEGAAAPVQASLSAQHAPEDGEGDPRFHAFFDDTLAVRLREGRIFTAADTANSEPVVTVSAALAESLWPGQTALGKRLRVIGASGVAETWRRVVGLTTDNPDTFMSENNPASLVVPLPQIDTPGKSFNVSAFASSAAGKGEVTRFLQDEFAAVDTALQSAVQDPAALLTGFANAFRTAVRLALLVGLFVFAVAVAGIYGVTQNSVLMATHEIGVRRALGARDGAIARMFMKRAGRQVVKGFVFAVLVCAPATLIFFGLAGEFRFDVGPGLVASMCVIAILYAVVMLATWLPVRRILRMEPSEALRHE